MRACFRWFFVALITLSVAAPALAQRGFGRSGGGRDDQPPQPRDWAGKAAIEGKVLDDMGKGLGGVRITFVYVATNSGFFLKTKKNGEFEAKNMKAGEWKLQADMPDFVTVRQTAQVGDGKNAPVSLQMKRDNSPALLAKGDDLFKAGKFAEARAEYLQVLQNHPELTAINRSIAFTYGREKNHPEALKYLDLALSGNPNDAQLLQLAAASATETADYARAMGYLDKIDEATLPNPDPLSNAAVALLKKGQIAGGVKVLDRVIARFPDAPEPYFYRGAGRLQADQKAEAKADLEKFVALAPPDAPMVAQAKEWLGQIK